MITLSSSTSCRLYPVKKVNQYSYAALACEIMKDDGSLYLVEPSEQYFGYLVCEYRTIYNGTLPHMASTDGQQVVYYNDMELCYKIAPSDFIISTYDTSTTKSAYGTGYSSWDPSIKRNDIHIPNGMSNYTVLGGLGAIKMKYPVTSSQNTSTYNIQYKVIIETDGPITPIGILGCACGSTTDTCPSMNLVRSQLLLNDCLFLHTGSEDFVNDSTAHTYIRKIIDFGTGNFGNRYLWLVTTHLHGSVRVKESTSALKMANKWISNPMVRLHQSDTSKSFSATIHSYNIAVFNENF